LDHDEQSIIVNDIEHEKFGKPGAFCGPVMHHELRRAEAEITTLREKLVRAEEEIRIFICPKCDTEFEDPNPSKDYSNGILCPECKGMVKGVIHPEKCIRKITQYRWDEVNRKLNNLRTGIEVILQSAGDGDWIVGPLERLLEENK